MHAWYFLVEHFVIEGKSAPSIGVGTSGCAPRFRVHCRARIFENRSRWPSATSNVLSVLCIVGSVQPDIQHVAMLRRLPAPALSSAVELLQVVSFEERLGTVAPDGWAGSRAAAASHNARDEQRLLCALSLFIVCDDSLASVSESHRKPAANEGEC